MRSRSRRSPVKRSSRLRAVLKASTTSVTRQFWARIMKTSTSRGWSLVPSDSRPAQSCVMPRTVATTPPAVRWHRMPCSALNWTRGSIPGHALP